MIEIVRGNLLAAEVDVLVNTVNTMGVMGKGVALQFKKAFPENFEAYKRACDNKEIRIGQVFVFDVNMLHGPRFIINFPTKRHWKDRSRLKDIEAGLQSLVVEIRKLGIRSLAVPPLGCGLGGLDWADVRPRIEQAFAALPDVRVLLYEPVGAPAAKAMINRTPRPVMTLGRAAILGLMNRYRVPGYDYLLSLLEIQKLAYFMQAAGEPLKLAFQKGPYGPYADNLRHVLNVMEGHFITGYGEGRNKPGTPISLKPGAADEAEVFLTDHPDTKARFSRVVDVIEGFETPYGMELLSSVHWVSTQEDARARHDVDAAILGIQNWNERKKTLLKVNHVKTAWNRLRDKGWLNDSGA
jgi:O-acetyl-ADP-ribose deacetylase (regulator of RNase III)